MAYTETHSIQANSLNRPRPHPTNHSTKRHGQIFITLACFVFGLPKTASVPTQISLALRPRLKKIGRIMLEIDHDNLFSHLFEFTVHPDTIFIPRRYENVSK